MTTDEEFLAEREASDRRRYLIKTLDFESSPRYAAAFTAGRELLEANRLVAHANLVAAMVRSSDMLVKSVENRLRELVAHGFIAKQGAYSRIKRRGKWAVTDTRAYAMGDWPRPGDEDSGEDE